MRPLALQLAGIGARVIISWLDPGRSELGQGNDSTHPVILL